MEVILMIVGAIIGAVISWSIAHKYHKKASDEFQVQIDAITLLNKDLAKSVSELIDVSNFTAEKAEMIEKHAVVGTTDDPDYPYK
ncbi:hypothetical protein L2719_14950 [Shewanella schlegeliana]|uniref:Uncharacterized protein n=1 Tax=Shewanella schlegeliana TaxID=190308 RepID=A0ABS1T043_9GAMM|nr:hypothetical protein [Shewanella schlegeliana]MBL4914130.1 hypothetical protein [Shewanella schlegeliana]MCL1110833.1 hypothetical protein [Shewanella schlegeliana]GIU36334.1 hypothetical protein TUM4433_34930 [Shewanella schlegeliana]